MSTDELRDVIVQHCELQEGPCPRLYPCTGGKCLRKPAADDAINPLEPADCEHDYEALDEKGWECKLCGHQT